MGWGRGNGENISIAGMALHCLTGLEGLVARGSRRTLKRRQPRAASPYQLERASLLLDPPASPDPCLVADAQPQGGKPGFKRSPLHPRGSQPPITALTGSLEGQLQALGAVEVVGRADDPGRGLGLAPQREDAGEQEAAALRVHELPLRLVHGHVA